MKGPSASTDLVPDASSLSMYRSGPRLSTSSAAPVRGRRRSNMSAAIDVIALGLGGGIRLNVTYPALISMNYFRFFLFGEGSGVIARNGCERVSNRSRLADCDSGYKLCVEAVKFCDRGNLVFLLPPTLQNLRRVSARRHMCSIIPLLNPPRSSSACPA